ncbi:hypothetical protein SFRURICE_000498 [Spodoptera frugiperda]|nr:hypothetical protein SFRURICE_000498 [Spodoptera frugiperda]
MSATTAGDSLAEGTMGAKLESPVAARQSLRRVSRNAAHKYERLETSRGFSSGFKSTIGTFIGIFSLRLILISEQEKKFSWLPQPRAPVPSPQKPQLLPAVYFHCSTQ